MGDEAHRLGGGPGHTTVAGRMEWGVGVWKSEIGIVWGDSKLDGGLALGCLFLGGVGCLMFSRSPSAPYLIRADCRRARRHTRKGQMIRSAV